MTAHTKRPFPGLLRLPHNLHVVLSAVTAALFLISAAAPVFAQVGQQEVILPELKDVECQSYIVYDRTKKEILLSKDPDKKIYPASMTKIMTAALALDNLKTDQILTTSAAAIAATTPNSSLMGLVVGEQISVSELMYGLMLPSGNDAANVLAEAIVDATGYKAPTPAVVTNADGTIVSASPRSKLSLFTDLMNQKAKDLGLTNTHFMNANGLQDDNHYTTAFELAKIFDYALGHEDFLAVISSPTHVFKATNKHKFDAWSIAKNSNCLLTDPWILGADTKVAKIAGGKTGTTITAGSGLTLYSVDKNADELISVVCGIPYVNAARLTSYMGTILNAGAAACYNKDAVDRYAGNVMDNKPYNAPANLGPSGSTAVTATPSPTAAPTAAATAAPTDAAVTPASNNNNKTSTFPMNFITANPVISIILGVIITLLILLVIVYFAVNRKSKNSYGGIRRL